MLSLFKYCPVPGFCVNGGDTLENMKVGPLITGWDVFSSLKKEISALLAATCFLFGLLLQSWRWR
jgi:hypothetical protein